jgi:uncharacterized protein
MKELTPKLLEDITRSLQKAINPVKIYLFGSYAAGCADDDSDIDLLVVVPDTSKSMREITIEGRKSLKQIEIPLDLIVCTEFQFDRFRNVKNSIMNEAFCFGRIIYGC